MFNESSDAQRDPTLLQVNGAPPHNAPIDETARRSFEAAWRSGTPHAIEDFLPAVNDSRYLGTLEELVLIELEFSWRSFFKRAVGDQIRNPPLIEDYLVRFPQLKTPPLLEHLVREELRLRKRSVQQLSTAEYRQRFPELASVQMFGETAGVGETPRIPGYEILQVVGRGGMGAVFRARDIALQRHVAIKILHESYGADARASTRFIEEARIAGQLQHPSIPAVYQVGRLEDGRPFLAMKLIKGSTLDALIKAGQPINTLAIFEAICQAIGFAHAHHVIHRDLKPSNIMVGGFGEVQVMDWGLAKVLTDVPEPKLFTAEVSAATEIKTFRSGDTSLTQTGSVMGTPAYMAPEQAASEQHKIDARSDVFGLGAVLCSLLTGRPPYDGVDAESIHLNAVRGLTGEAFARLDHCGADPEVVALCKRCLAFDPQQRPADGGAVAAAVAAIRLAADERAHQAERDKTRAEVQTAEQRKRRKVQIALASLAVVVLIGSGAAAWWADRQANDRRERHARNAEAIEFLLGQAETALQDDDAAAAEVPVAQAEKRAAEGGADHLRARIERRHKDLAMLKDLDRIDRFRWTLTDYKVPKSEVVSAEWSGAFARFGIVPGATDPAEAARLINESLIRDQLLSALDTWLVDSLSREVLALANTADPDVFRDAFREAIQQGQGERLAELAIQPQAGVQPLRFVILMGGLRTLAFEQRERFLRQAFERKPRSLPVLMGLGRFYLHSNPERAAGWYRAALAARENNATIWYNLGYVALLARDFENASAAYREVIRLEPQYHAGFTGLGAALNGKGLYEEATAVLKEAIRLGPNDGHAHNGLAAVLANQNDLEGAIDESNLAIKYEPTHALAHFNRGLTLYRKSDLDGAIASYREAARLDPANLETQRNIGKILLEKADWAITSIREAIRVNPKNAVAHHDLAVALYHKWYFIEAIAESRFAIRLDPTNYKAHYQLGLVLDANQDSVGAIAAFRESIRIDPTYVNAHMSLGRALWAQKDLIGAKDAYEVAIKFDPNYAPGHAGLGYVLREMNKLDEALTACREAIRLDPKSAFAHYGLGYTLNLKGDIDKSIVEYREAIRLDPNYLLAHNNLGYSLSLKWDSEGAIAAYSEAARLDGRDVRIRWQLGRLLRNTGRLAEAREAFLDAQKVNGPIRDQNYFIQTALAETENLITLEKRHAAFVVSGVRPLSAAEICCLAEWCYCHKRYQAAVGFYAGAFARDARLGDDLENGYRYNAAAAAAWAADGKGIDPPSLGDRPELRRQARDWLAAELAARTNALTADEVRQRAIDRIWLHAWLADEALAGIRNADRLRTLHPDEQALLERLWRDVRALYNRAAPPEWLPAPRIAPGEK